MTEVEPAVVIEPGQCAGITVYPHDRRRDSRAGLADHHAPCRLAFARQRVERNAPFAFNRGNRCRGWRGCGGADGLERIRGTTRAAVVLPFKVIVLVHNLYSCAVLIEWQHQLTVRKRPRPGRPCQIAIEE